MVLFWRGKRNKRIWNRKKQGAIAICFLDRHPFLLLFSIWASCCLCAYANTCYFSREIFASSIYIIRPMLYLFFSLPTVFLSFSQSLYMDEIFWMSRRTLRTGISILLGFLFLFALTCMFSETSFLWPVLLTESIFISAAILCATNYSNYKYTAKASFMLSIIYWVLLTWRIYKAVQ